ncbi:choice-of-anchor P family protein [Terracoccus luteus]|uniref:choice-of-anchor P family protein n=1 Tax=Terracoccus luteus TaxID=53356 RepID=UPI0011C484F4|nr:choice-of-anchor P family protein [Terracoccus luteus]
MRRWTSWLRLRTAAVAVLGAVAVVAVGAGPAQAATAGNKAFAGYAHDLKSYVLATGAVSAGPVVAAGVGCSDRATLFYQDSAASSSLLGLTLNGVQTSSGGFKSGTVQENRSTFSTTNVNLPIGTASLRADSISVTTSVFYDTSTRTFSQSSTMTVANLRVLLTPLGPTIVSINGTVQPNFGITVPGIATLVLHGNRVSGSANSSAMGTLSTAVQVDLLGGLSSTRVGEVSASLYGTPDQTFMYGQGEGVRVAASDQLLTVGPLVTAQLPCVGNGGAASSVAGTNGLPALLGNLGVVTSTATGSRSDLQADARTTSQVASVNLLGGLVTADAVGSTSRVTSTDGAETVDRSASASTFTGLTVAGVPVSADAAPGTTISLAGIGQVVLNARTAYPTGVEVIPLTVRVNPGNTLGLPSATIVVARSYAFLTGPETTPAALKAARSFMTKQSDEPAEAVKPAPSSPVTGLQKQAATSSAKRTWSDGGTHRVAVAPTVKAPTKAPTKVTAKG